MQYLNAIIAINGDSMNQTYRESISVAELELLRKIHGAQSVTEIRIVKKARTIHNEEMDRLKEAYPYQFGIIDELNRDFGGKLPADVRDIRLEPFQLAQAPVKDLDVETLRAQLEEAAEAEAEEDDD
jgi:hypothetical protein